MQTVTGPLNPGAAGHWQIHEHIFLRRTQMTDRNSALLIDNEALSAEELKNYRLCGGEGIVDAQPAGAGRDAQELTLLSKKSGVGIIASTGYHLMGYYDEGHWIFSLTEHELTELFISELREGMLPWSENTKYCPDGRLGARAGIVKAAITEEGPVGEYKKMLNSAAAAAAECKAPLMLHTESGRFAEEAVKICLKNGLPAEKIVVCHADRQADDMSLHEKIAALGVFMDYDTIGRFKYHSDEDELRLISHMLSAGAGGQLLLSLDTTAKRLCSYGGKIGLSYLLREFIPKMKEFGINEAEIRKMSSDNIKSLFS
ncbi:MAG: phosphotriesterase [Bacillota bacterium]|nr:phosphotriesterase [Bacillota bacterium]